MNKDSKRDRFKSHLRKIGSGEKSSRGMTREESAEALELMLQRIPSDAQIGAFMIAHRIRRPEPQELAGMIDTYLKLGPKIRISKSIRKPICFGMPLDGRNRTAPVYPLSTLVLLDVGQPVVLHGGSRMPVKYGVTAIELFNALGLTLNGLTIDQLQECFSKFGFAFIYQPDHFKLADNLIKYREEIGKRPPLASMELLWTAHKGDHLLITGYVHSPTVQRHLQTAKMLGEKDVCTVKGLEGSTDISINHPLKISRLNENSIEEFTLNPVDYRYYGKDYAWENIDQWQKESLKALNGDGNFTKAVIWNAGIYLWLGQITNSLAEGIKKAENSLLSGSAMKTLNELIKWRKKID